MSCCFSSFIAMTWIGGSLKILMIYSLHEPSSCTISKCSNRVISDYCHAVYARGINKESLIFRMAILHYNYIKPHSGIGNRTPAEAAGIDVQGADRWLTLIQNAVSAA